MDGTVKRMEILIKATSDVNELKRVQSIYFRAKYGMSAEQIADMVGWSVGTIRNIHHEYMKHGEGALKVHSRGGRYHDYLSEEEEELLLAPFTLSGKEGHILEVNKISQAYEQRIGKKVAKSTIYRLLHRHGWRKITPRPRHPKADEQVMEAFKKTSNAH